MDKTEELRRQINDLEEKLRMRLDLEEQLAHAEYELICSTATMHVAIDDGKSVRVWAVSPELPTPTPWLRFTVDAGRIVSARAEFLDGSVTFFLSAGSQVSFELTGDEIDGGDVTLHVRAFASEAEVDDWANQRRQGNVSH